MGGNAIVYVVDVAVKPVRWFYVDPSNIAAWPGVIYIYPRRTYLGLENRRQYIFNVGADRGAGWYWGFDCTCQQLKPLVFTPLGKTGCFCDNWPCCPTTIGFYVLVESRFPALDNAIKR